MHTHAHEHTYITVVSKQQERPLKYAMLFSCTHNLPTLWLHVAATAKGVAIVVVVVVVVATAGVLAVVARLGSA